MSDSDTVMVTLIKDIELMQVSLLGGVDHGTVYTGCGT